MVFSQTDRIVSEISGLQSDKEKPDSDSDLAIIKETLEEMSEAHNFHDTEVTGKLSAIEAKLEKNSVTEYHGIVSKELGSIKALVTQNSKVCSRKYFLFYYPMVFVPLLPYIEVYIIPPILISFHDYFTLKLGHFKF